MFRRVPLGLTSALVLTMVCVIGYSITLHIPPLSAAAQGRCQGLPDEAALKGFLGAAPAAGGEAGGLFHGTRMWAAVVNRDGEVCAYTQPRQPIRHKSGPGARRSQRRRLTRRTRSASIAWRCPPPCCTRSHSPATHSGVWANRTCSSRSFSRRRQDKAAAGNRSRAA